jgi:hypothetical protein
MLDILADEPCWRADCILRQAHHVLSAYCGFYVHRHNVVALKTHEKTKVR